MDYLAAEDFIARLHVCEVQVRGHVGKRGEHIVADRVPKIQNAMRAAAAKKARAEHHVRLTRQNWRKQTVIFRRVVFQICILNDDDVCGRVGDARAQGRTFALIHLVADQLDARLVLRERLKLFPGVVSRTIVYDDELLNRSLGEHNPDNFGDGGGLVEDGHDGRQARCDVSVGLDFSHAAV